MAYTINVDGEHVNKPFDCIGDAYNEGKKFNKDFTVHETKDGLTEAEPVMKHTAEGKDDDGPSLLLG